MKRFFFFLLIAISVDFAAQKTITVMFYNVENFFDYADDPKTQDEEFLPNSPKKWDKSKYENKIKRISEVIDSSVGGIALPDIIGFCEIENVSVLNDLVSKTQLRKRTYTALCTTGKDTRGINVGLIYDKSAFEFVSYKEVDAIYPVEPNNKTRNILFVALRFKATGELCYIFVNHWPSRRDGELLTEPRRVHAASVVRKEIDSLLAADKNAKIIVMGDLNDTPKNNSVLNILKANANPKPGELLNPYFDYEAVGKGTHLDNDQWHVFDNIILSTPFLGNKGLHFKPKSAYILNKDFVLFKNYKSGAVKPNRTYGGNKYFNGYSDHLAVYVTLRY